ncbi:MAG: hypothetical protein P4L83_18350 [Nevskia sp.]|nr:hypothetical protein [Nevskia sp.]
MRGVMAGLCGVAAFLLIGTFRAWWSHSYHGTLIQWLAELLAESLLLTVVALGLRWSLLRHRAMDAIKTRHLLDFLGNRATPLPVVKPVHAVLLDDELAHAACNAMLDEPGSAQHEETDSSGELAITNRRVVFAGHARGFELRLGALTHFTRNADRFRFHQGAASHLVRIPDPMDRQRCAAVLERLLTRGGDE